MKRIEKEGRAEKNVAKKIWYFLWKDDSALSWVVSLLLALVIVKFIFFPLLSFVFNSPLPLVVVESCSMNHPGIFGGTFSNYWENYGEWYEDRNISQEEFRTFSFRQGSKMGDIFLVSNRSRLDLGDVIIFDAKQANPIIHRIIGIRQENGTIIYSTKGDDNPVQLPFENTIYRSQILGEAVFKIPRVGWVKLIFVKVYQYFIGIPQNPWC